MGSSHILDAQTANLTRGATGEEGIGEAAAAHPGENMGRYKRQSKGKKMEKVFQFSRF